MILLIKKELNDVVYEISDLKGSVTNIQVKTSEQFLEVNKINFNTNDIFTHSSKANTILTGNVKKVIKDLNEKSKDLNTIASQYNVEL